MTKFLVAAILCATATVALTADDHHDHSQHHLMSGDHAHHQQQPVPETRLAPTEPGQAAFAAIAEIVQLLEQDPDTDWSTINIQTLREHLVDMANLTLKATTTQRLLNDHIVFIVTGTDDTLGAIQRMVPVHAAIVAKARGWQVTTEPVTSGLKLTIKTNRADRVKLAGLGFFGFMALENHHQHHHLQMATGGGHLH